MYADAGLTWHRARYRFSKYYLGAGQVPAFSGNEIGEEFQCAQIIDSLPQVEFWLRNVSQHPRAFRLPTDTDNFYPDFVGELTDGRLFVVEYKGEPCATNDDSNEKRTVGVLWEKNTAGKGIFLMAEKVVGGKDVRAQLVEHFGV
jgi:type III restriction enzyme